jgi:hypothetical protein
MYYKHDSTIGSIPQGFDDDVLYSETIFFFPSIVDL